MGRERHVFGSGKQFVRSHVARDLYFYLNYNLLLFYYIYYFDYIIKIAPDEFDIRCWFIIILHRTT